MNTAVSADPARLGSNVSQRERWQTNLELFQRVTKAYVQLRDLPPVVAMNPDPNPVSRSLPWTPASAEFACDCEHAIRAAIANRPDANELLQAWNSLLADTDRIGAAEKRLVERATPIFRARGLDPKQYFVQVRRKVGEKIR